jgi:hypothetical protein
MGSTPVRGKADGALLPRRAGWRRQPRAAYPVWISICRRRSHGSAPHTSQGAVALETAIVREVCGALYGLKTWLGPHAVATLEQLGLAMRAPRRGHTGRSPAKARDMIDVTQRRDVTILCMAHGKANALDVELCRGITERLESLRTSSSRAELLIG